MTPHIPENIRTLFAGWSFVTSGATRYRRGTPTTTRTMMMPPRTTATRTTTSRRSSENLTNRLLDGSPQGRFRL